MSRNRWVTLGLLFVIAIVAAASLTTGTKRTKDHSKVPLGRSEFLRAVLEPITMVNGVSWDDNSQGLASDGASREECLPAVS